MSELRPLRVRSHVSELTVLQLRGHVSERSRTAQRDDRDSAEPLNATRGAEGGSGATALEHRFLHRCPAGCEYRSQHVRRGGRLKC